MNDRSFYLMINKLSIIIGGKYVRAIIGAAGM